MRTASYQIKTQQEIAEEKKNQRKALLMTIGIYSIILLIILYIKLSPPDPPIPIPEDSSMEVVWGETNAGRNPVFDQPAPASRQPQKQEVQPQPKVTQPEAVKYETSNDREAPTVKETTKEVVKETPKVEPKPRQVDKRTLFEDSPGSSSSEGGKNASKGTTYEDGNQGDPNGNKNARSWEGGGKGNGPGFSLSGRSAVALPQPPGITNQSGIVVVAIDVDQEGNVVSVRGGVRGSTTTNAALIDQAERYARKAKFSANPNAPEVQSGTITYNFLLQ